MCAVQLIAVDVVSKCARLISHAHAHCQCNHVSSTACCSLGLFVAVASALCMSACHVAIRRHKRLTCQPAFDYCSNVKIPDRQSRVFMVPGFLAKPGEDLSIHAECVRLSLAHNSSGFTFITACKRLNQPASGPALCWSGHVCS